MGIGFQETHLFFFYKNKLILGKKKRKKEKTPLLTRITVLTIIRTNLVIGIGEQNQK